MRRAVVLALVASCGDGVPAEATLEATSGSRMKVEWIYYADGSRQPTAGGFYDTELHARCIPTQWSDGAIRCAPIADPAAFTDSECTRSVGLALSGDTRPEYFIGYDLVADIDAIPARLYRAGANIAGVGELYQLTDTGLCSGPAAPPGVAYFEAIAAFDADAMVAFEERFVTEPGDPLTLVVRETADGLRVPVGVQDNALGLPCTPQVRGDTMVCAPDGFDADVFLDPSCTEPGVQVLEGFPPSIVRALDPTGCPAEHALGERAGTTMYRRTQAGCVRVPPDPSLIAYALGPRLATPVLERSVDDDGGNRLMRVTLGAGSLRWRADQMYDSATRGDCRPQVFGEAFRCLPATTAQVQTLLAPGCGFEVRVTELRTPACNPTTFANSFGTDGQLRAIGDPSAELFTLATGTCAPYAPPQGSVVHELGPPLPAETFTPGIPAGER